MNLCVWNLDNEPVCTLQDLDIWNDIRQNLLCDCRYKRLCCDHHKRLCSDYYSYLYLYCDRYKRLYFGYCNHSFHDYLKVRLLHLQNFHFLYGQSGLFQ